MAAIHTWKWSKPQELFKKQILTWFALLSSPKIKQNMVVSGKPTWMLRMNKLLLLTSNLILMTVCELNLQILWSKQHSTSVSLLQDNAHDWPSLQFFFQWKYLPLRGVVGGAKSA